MKLLKILLITSSLIIPLLHAETNKTTTCENAIPLQDFLKETSKYEDELALYKSKNSLLEEENKKLINQLKELKSKTPKITTTKEDKNKFKAGIYKVTWDEANIYINNAPNSASPYSLVKDERVQVESCDSFGWCKLKDKRLFIKRHTIAFDTVNN